MRPRDRGVIVQTGSALGRRGIPLPAMADAVAPGIVVAPATYNTVNKWAQGTSDTYALGIALRLGGRRVPQADAATALARALSRSIECQFARVQCTADLLPADIVGTNVYNQREGRFEFRPGPIFAQVVLADEISPDGCRLWDITTNEKLDKDRFRRDLGRVEEGYQELCCQRTFERRWKKWLA